jgi:hypothetical protein
MAQNETETETVGPVPEENQPGHQPAEDQDKPDLDQFAKRFGIPPENDASREQAPSAEVPVADVIDLTQERFEASDAAEVRIVERSPVVDAPRMAPEPVTLGPVAEVVDAVWDFSRAGLRLFVVTPIKVSWSVGSTLKRAATGRSAHT